MAKKACQKIRQRNPENVIIGWLKGEAYTSGTPLF